MKGSQDARDADHEPRPGVLVVGHGTRSVAGLGEFRAVVEQLAIRLAPTPVEPCFLELAEPTIAAGIARLRERGVERFVVAPLLLFAAGHAKHDIPAAVAAAADIEGGLAWAQAEPLGLDRRVVELSVLRYDETITAALPPEAKPIADADTLLLLVGRGAVDAEAIAAMQKFAALRAAARPVGAIELAFTALAEPLVEQVLPRVAESRYRRIVVQPHLLFAGQLLEKLRTQVQAAAASTPTKQWSLADHLGPHPFLVEALLDRIAAAEELR